jgi:hypothetical protein
LWSTSTGLNKQKKNKISWLLGKQHISARRETTWVAWSEWWALPGLVILVQLQHGHGRDGIGARRRSRLRRWLGLPR